MERMSTCLPRIIDLPSARGTRFATQCIPFPLDTRYDTVYFIYVVHSSIHFDFDDDLAYLVRKQWILESSFHRRTSRLHRPYTEARSNLGEIIVLAELFTAPHDARTEIVLVVNRIPDAELAVPLVNREVLRTRQDIRMLAYKTCDTQASFR